ncbi:MAG: glycosyltransferase family 4 protein [Armatimonadota bacterium]
MKILVISNLCPPDYDGGFELSALRNAESLRDLGHEVEFVTGEYRVSFQGERIDPQWVRRIFKLPPSNDSWAKAEMFLGGASDLRFKVRNIFSELGLRYSNIRGLMQMLKVAPKNEAALDKFLESRDFDVAYVFGLHKIGTSVIRSLMKKKIPVLYHQGDEWLAAYIKPGLAKRILLNIVSPVTFSKERNIDLKNVFLVSQFMKGRFLVSGFHQEQLGVIYRGVEYPLAQNLDRERFDPPIFLVASRLTFYKGIQFAIRAAASLDQRAPNDTWELWIAGHSDPYSLNTFTKLVSELKIEHRVKFIGKLSRDSVFGFMQRATAVISPSVFDEPFGNTNIEALASGTTLIASRSGAIEEILEHGKSGLIYDRQNYEELAQHMQLILQNPNLRRSLQVEGLNRVKAMFTQENVINQVEAKLAEISGSDIEALAEEANKVSLQ